MPNKRRLSEEESPTAEEMPQKRSRRGKSAIQFVEDIEERMDTINRLPRDYAIGIGIYEIPRSLLKPRTSAEAVSTQLETFKEFCKITHEIVSAKLGELTPGGDSKQEHLRGDFIEGEVELAALISMVDELKSTLFSKPPPSAYADVSIWKDVQTYPRPILCLRPTDKHGLPLVLLHSIFSQFQHLSCQPLPNSLAGVNALRVALRLCSSMGDSFDDEKARGGVFDQAMGGFLQAMGSARRLEGNRVSGEANIYHVGGRCMIFRQDKVEIGAGGDAYTHVARSYDLACEQMERNGVVPDTPAFLLCVMGPTLTIAGGFKDGEDTVVEPLCPILVMLKDMDNVNGRAVQLATHLFALQACLGHLSLLPNSSSLVSGLPRVFPSFQNAQEREHMLTFRRRLSPDLLLFRAVDENSRELCVKIVYGPYGEEVHRMLGREQMAPNLLGISRIDGGPTMVVMEMLDEPWQTLYIFAQRNSRWTADGVKPAIHKRLEEILAKLEAEGFVHGDFRANNIMVKPGEEESVMVIDFDWAGKDGEVHYPLYRNDEGVRWPSEAGSAIRSAHDRSMLGTEWNSILKPWTVG